MYWRIRLPRRLCGRPRQPNDVSVADTLSGVLNYRRLLVGATLMSRRLAHFPEPHVGVMLPASVAADLVFFALQLAGKVPVMMNWTTGPANLAHGVKVTGVTRILTSKKMVDRLGIDVAGAEYVFLEDLKDSIGKLEALWTLLRSVCLPGSFLRRYPLNKRIKLLSSCSRRGRRVCPRPFRSHIAICW